MTTRSTSTTRTITTTSSPTPLDVVTQAKADLLAAGENLDHACGAFKITATAAYRLNPTADPNGWGLIHSTGNGCDANNDRYRTDTMMLSNGTVYDCLLHAESFDGLVYPAVGHEAYNVPAWNPTGPQDPANWRAPYDPGLVDSGTAPGPGPAPTPPADTQAILDAIAASEAAVRAHVTAEADRVIAAVLGDLKRLEEEVEQFAKQLGTVLIILRRRGGEPEEPPAT